MSIGKIVILVFIAALAVWFFRDPHRTALPFGSTDLTSVRRQLDRLSAQERQLVEDYVKRSKGDVLPAKFADPEEPLTARTFGEAIKLQRAWREKMAKDGERANKLKAQRQARLQPLRDVVDARVVEAKIMTRNEYQALRDPSFYQQAYQVDESPVFVTRVRVRNRSSQAVVSMKGSLQARDSQAYLALDLCWIELRDALPAFGQVEFDCGHPSRGASEQQRAFAENRAGRFEIEWHPSYVKLADGRELDGGR